MLNSFRLFSSLLLCGLLAACSTSPKIGGHRIDTSLQAAGQNSRVRHLVLHYTSADTPTSIKVLTQKNVSSHYLITDEHPPKLYRFVDESQRAWHAGVSQWHDHVDLNTSSIGIEIVNAGRLPDHSWAPYQSAQIELLTALLQELVERHRISPANIVGHSDVAPQRKIDPGPLFPWEQLARAGLGRWYNQEQALRHQAQFEQFGLAPPYAEIQQMLKQAGYEVPLHGQWDKASQNVLAAFQMRYRPSLYDGQPDAQTLGILKALLD